MTRISYDMMAIGNHEFDNGVESFADSFITTVTEELLFPSLVAILISHLMLVFKGQLKP